MKTIPFKFRFSDNPWCVEILQGNRMTRGAMQFPPPPTGAKPTDPKADPHGMNLAERTLFAKEHPQQWKVMNGSKPTTFEEFQKKQICVEQGRALDTASLYGIIRAPQNYVSEFWTPEFVIKLARALTRPRKADELRLANWLVRNWEKTRLFGLTREQLTKQVNSRLKTSYRSAKVWQTAYRIGLVSDRNPGPLMHC